LATSIYFPFLSDASNSKNIARSRLLALFLLTALPTFFEVTKATSIVSFPPLKKATKEWLCHFSPLLYILLISLELLIL